VLNIGFLAQNFLEHVMVLGLKLMQFAQKMMDVAMFFRGPDARSIFPSLMLGVQD
jgi:hypothetical protein